MGKLVEKGSKYTDEDRRRAAIEYCSTGNMSKVSDNTDIPKSTLSHWRLHTDWWVELVGEVRNEMSDQILAQNMEIATKAGERVLDSLEYGDEKLVWDKDKGEHVIKYVKPTGKDSMVISGISQDKARVQLNLPTSITTSQTTQEQLKAVLDQCAAVADTLKEKRANSIAGESEEIE